MAYFEFATADRIVFGENTASTAADTIQRLGSHPLVVVDSSFSGAERVLDDLGMRGISYETCLVEGEPSIESVETAVGLANAAGCDAVLAVGGGSVIDTGKAVAALVANGGRTLDYLEVVGAGKSLTQPSLPVIAVPTTAGTGAEVTRNAVIKATEQRVKVSLRSPYMLPTVSIVDPVLTVSMPPSVTASTGLDALTQCLEPYVSIQSNPLTDAIALAGLRRAAVSLRRAYDNGSDLAARTNMSLASLFGGLALANAKLGAVHGFAGVLGGMYPAPHGIVCARLLPFVMETNVIALESREPDSPILERYGDVARVVTGDPSASVADGVVWMQGLCATLAVPGLADFGVQESEFAEIVSQTQRASSMQGNSLPLTDEELTSVLRQAL